MYASACYDLQEEDFVPVLTQAICHYLLDSNAKAKRLFKDAMTKGRDLQLDSNVQKALSKTWSKLNRVRLGKVFGKLKRGTSFSSSVAYTSGGSELDMMRE